MHFKVRLRGLLSPHYFLRCSYEHRRRSCDPLLFPEPRLRLSALHHVGAQAEWGTCKEHKLSGHRLKRAHHLGGQSCMCGAPPGLRVPAAEERKLGRIVSWGGARTTLCGTSWQGNNLGIAPAEEVDQLEGTQNRGYGTVANDA